MVITFMEVLITMVTIQLEDYVIRHKSLKEANIIQGIVTMPREAFSKGLTRP